MGTKTKILLGALKLFGVNTRGIESIMEKLSEKNSKPEEDYGAYWDGEYGDFVLVDKAGNKLTNETFANVSSFSEGLAGIEQQKDKGAKWGFIDPNGKFPFKPIYDEVQLYANGLAPVQLKKKWGYIYKTGKEAIPFKYDAATPFNLNVKDQAQVRQGGKWFYIDKAGNCIKNSEKPNGWS